MKARRHKFGNQNAHTGNKTICLASTPLPTGKHLENPSYSGLAFIVNGSRKNTASMPATYRNNTVALKSPKIRNGGFYRMSTGRNPVNNLKTKSKGNPFRNATNTRKRKIRAAEHTTSGFNPTWTDFSFRTSLSTTPAANNPPKPKPTTIIKF